MRLAEFSVHFKVGECRLNGDLIRINKSRTSLEDKRFEPWYLRLYCNNRLVPVSPLWQPKSQFLKSVPCLTGNQNKVGEHMIHISERGELSNTDGKRKAKECGRRRGDEVKWRDSAKFYPNYVNMHL